MMNENEVCVGVRLGDVFPEVGKTLILTGYPDEYFVPASITKLEWKSYENLDKIMINEVLVFMTGTE